ncbi:MAG: protein kinase [Acidobacteriota bacterium]|nr:MAG: protein kinase [Acidobacteriota bacterium]
MIGQIVSHYRIIEPLGSGGMGVVYRAEDTRLKRNVAIKFLPPDLFENELALKRFKREARSAASLNHPNICVVHDVGEYEEQPYLVMELLEGETLEQRIRQEPLKPAEIIQLASQIASALETAHSQGIIHRDIKPGNIFITRQGFAKVLDFGLAKQLSEDQETRQDLSSALTTEGTRLGTLTYMSPEQLRGQELDARTDLFSFGVVLYEMMTRVHPFRRETGADTASAVLNEEPPPLDICLTSVPVALERLLKGLLAKDLNRRFQSMGQVREELNTLAESSDDGSRRGQVRWLLWSFLCLAALLSLVLGFILFRGDILRNGGPLQETREPRSGQKYESLAVLPLKNLTGDPGQEFFVDGMTEALTTELSRLRELKVIARTSAMRYKQTDLGAREIAADLGVAALIEGSVVRGEGRVRITAQLIDGESEEHVWVQNFDRESTDILALYSDVARSVAREIQIVVSPDEVRQLTLRHSVNPDAYELFLKGRQQYNQWTVEGFQAATPYFEEAIKIDPDWAPAYAGLVSCRNWLVWFGAASARETYALSSELLEKALNLDSEDPEVVTIRADMSFYFDWDWDRADREYRRAIELDRNSVKAHAYYAWYLMAVGRSAEALEAAQNAIQLDPLATSARLTLGEVHFNSRRFDEAVAAYRECIELEPNESASYEWLATVYEQLGQFDDAVAARREALSRSVVHPDAVESLERRYQEAGEQGYWEWRIDGLKERRAPYSFAEIYARRGDVDQALNWLERAIEERHTQVVLANVSPAFDAIRNHPRFQTLLQRMAFPN